MELLARLADPAFKDGPGKLLRTEFFAVDKQDAVKDLLHCKEVLSKGRIKSVLRRHGIKANLPEITKQKDYKFDTTEIKRYAKHHVLTEILTEAHVLRERGEYEKAFGLLVDGRKRLSLPDETLTTLSILDTPANQVSRGKRWTTGLSALDTPLDGGVAAGNLAVVMAPTSGGKSSWLIHIAAQTLQKGGRLAYVTLELSAGDIYLKAMKRLQKAYKREIGGIQRSLKKSGADCRIYEYPAYSVSVNELADRIGKVDMVLVDYADYLLGQDGKPGSDYQELGKIYVGLKTLAMEKHIPVWTASQVNRSGYGDDGYGLESIEGALKKAMVANQILGIQQASAGGDGVCNATIKILKNTFGPRFVDVKTTIEFSTCTFMEGSWTELEG